MKKNKLERIREKTFTTSYIILIENNSKKREPIQSNRT